MTGFDLETFKIVEDCLKTLSEVIQYFIEKIEIKYDTILGDFNALVSSF